MRKLMVIVGLASWAAVVSAVETEPCERWDDIGTNLALPEEIAGMRMQTRAEYEKNDQAFIYGSREFVAGTVGKRFLSFDLYNRDGENLEADGVSDDVRMELACIAKAVELTQHEGSTNVVVCKNQVLGKIGATDCVTAEFSYRDAALGADMRGGSLSSAFAGRFIMLRYYECVADADGKARSSSWPEVVKEVGLLMDRANWRAVPDTSRQLCAIICAFA